MNSITYSNLLTFSNIFDSIGISSLYVRPNFAPRFALNEPTRTITHVFIFNAFQHQDMRLYVNPHGWQEPYGKEIFMTYDRERYRKHLAPLKLPEEQENILLDELWTLTDNLARQARTAPLYPLQFALVAETYDAIERAIELESKENATEREKEEPCP